MLQIGYNLVHTETFIEHNKVYNKDSTEVTAPLPNGASQVDTGFVSWETSTIFKDDAGRRSYFVAELVSGLGGQDVSVVQPPFAILPVEDGSGCTPIGDSPVTQEFQVENLPFDVAIPMLTGWTLSYGCGDEHITQAGIWIDTWSYDQGTGTLRYTLSSAWKDKNGSPPHARTHKVTVLGLQAAATEPGGGNPQVVP
jgi:hypothetical protein